MFKIVYELWKNLKLKRRKQLSFLFILMLFNSFAELLTISAVIPFLTVLTYPDKIFNHENFQLFINYFEFQTSNEIIIPFILIFILITIISGFFRTVLLWKQIYLTQYIEADINLKIFDNILKEEMIVHKTRNSSDLISSISQKTNAVIASGIRPLMMLLSGFLTLLFVLTFLFILEPIMVLSIFAVFSLLYLIIIIVFKPVLKNNSKIISKKNNKLIQSLMEGFGSIREIILQNKQEFFTKNFHDADMSIRKTTAMNQFISSCPKLILEVVGIIILSTIAFIIFSQNGTIISSIPMLGVLALSAQRLLPIIQQMYFSFAAFYSGLALVEDVVNLLNNDNLISKNQQNIIINKINSINFNNVSFGYISDKKFKFVFKNLNFNIQEGQLIGLVGKTGSGKTSLIDTIMYLLKPQEGNIEINKTNIKKIDISSYQNKISHVPQNIYLTNDTIAENIAFGINKDLIDVAKLDKAIKIAELSDFIEELDKGIYTNVGENGQRLSGGQKQRLGIARSVYRNFSILILDEATSALDFETEKKILMNIKIKFPEKIIIIISHREHSLNICDKVLRIKNNTLFEDKINKLD